ncbi:MAG: MFS transporter, partial [Deltaproteobacteria bacterium]
FVAISQFGMAFSFHCILAFMPFYITRISPYGPKETIVWIGLIMGASNWIASVTASFWGGFASRIRPKLLFKFGMSVNGIMILLLGFTDNLTVLLLMRVFQGLLGGVSTIGLVLISRLSPSERLHEDLSLFQTCITTGQLLGPPVGAYAASLLGYKAPFFVAFIIVSVFVLFCHRNVTDIPAEKKELRSEEPLHKGVLFGWGLIFIATVHLAFLPSILPNILKGFQLMEDRALKSAGFIIMSYTGAAIVGNLLFSRLASKIGPRKVIQITCLVASCFLVVLILSGGVLSFTLIRIVEVGSIAAIIPLTFSIFARDVSGKVIGFLNSARFIGMAVGSLLATLVVAYSGLLTLYLLIAGFSLATLWAFLKATKGDEG